MRSHRKLRILPIGLALLSAAPLLAQELPSAVPEEVGMSSERLGRLTSALDAYVRDSRLPGAVAMVLRGRSSPPPDSMITPGCARSCTRRS